MLGGLLDVARYNLAHGTRDASIYESGRAYLRDGQSIGASTLGSNFPGERPPPAYEPWRLACVATGGDFFALKGVLEGIATGLGVAVDVEQGGEPFLSPGRAGRVLVEGEAIGWVGEIHPLVCRAWDLDAAVGFEIDLAPLVDASPTGDEQYEDVITYPAIEQDLAVIVDEATEAARVRAVVAEAGGELLRSITIFDLYHGDQVGEGRKSLALRLEFRAADRTLTDEEVSTIRERIEGALAEQLGGSLRG